MNRAEGDTRRYTPEQEPHPRQWVIFEELKARVGMEDILHHYGVMDSLRSMRKSGEFRGLCPFPDHQETRPSFDVNILRNNFKCWGCEKQGDIFDFVRYMGNLGEGRGATRQAALIVQEWFPTGLATTLQPPKMAPQFTQSPEKPQGGTRIPSGKAFLENIPLTFELKNLDTNHPYLKERGLTPETIEHFGLGYYGGRGVMKGRIVIPIHNQTGELVAYAGRWPGDAGWREGEEKYKFPYGFMKSHELFNLHLTSELAKEEGLVLVEGFFPVFHLWQVGIPNVVALMGSSMSQRQMDLLVGAVGTNGRVTLMLDGDDAGRRCTQDCLGKLARQVFVRAVDLPDGVQPENLGEAEIRQFL